MLLATSVSREVAGKLILGGCVPTPRRGTADLHRRVPGEGLRFHYPIKPLSPDLGCCLCFINEYAPRVWFHDWS